jgi:hypothetical protein
LMLALVRYSNATADQFPGDAAVAPAGS